MSRFPGDTGACGAPSTCVSSRTGALLGALNRWRLGRWRSTAPLQPCQYFPSCPLGWGREVLLSSLQTSPPRLLLWWRSSHAPSTDGTFTHWRSFAALSAGSSAGVTSRTSAPPGAVDRTKDTSALRQVIVGFSSLDHLHIQASFPRLFLWRHSPRAPSTGGTLHIDALRSALGRWCLRQWHSSALLLADLLPPPALLLAGDHLFSKMCSPIPEAPNYKKTQT